MLTYDPAAHVARFFLTLMILAMCCGAVFSQADSLNSGQEVMGPPEETPGTEAPAAVPGAGTAIPPGPLPILPVPQEAAPNTPPATREAIPAASGESWTGTAFPVLKAIGGFGLVVSLIIACYVLFRRFAPQYLNRRSGERTLKLIETLPMGEKRSIALVQAGARKYLLASTPGQISMLATYRDSIATISTQADTSAAKEPPAVPLGNFRNLYELEKKGPVSRSLTRATLPPDIRGKMQELRKALEG